MADVTLKRGDTYPPLRGRAADEDGALPLADAISAGGTILFLAKSGATLVSGTVNVIDPPDADGFNWQYVWDEGDTDVIGTYMVELEITWDNTPHEVQTIPNDGYLSLEIVQDLGGTD